MPRFLQSFLASRQPDCCSQQLETTESLLALAQSGKPPRAMVLEFGKFPVMRGLRYSLSKGRITRFRHGETRMISERESTAAEWTGFWTLMERLKVTSWRPEYRPPSNSGFVTLDGPGWIFRLRHESIRVQSYGRGAYPSITPPYSATTSAESLEILQAALDRLVEGAESCEEQSRDVDPTSATTDNSGD